MYKSSIFSQILKVLDKEVINESIDRHKSDKYSKGFGTWQHLISLIFAQLTGCKSIRDLEVRFNAKPQMHYHCRGVPLKRSTLSDANKSRKSEVFRDIAYGMMIGTQKLGVVNQVLSILDSTTITVSGRGSGWTEATRIRTGRGLKVHLQYGYDSEMIEDFIISATNVNDITAAQSFSLSPGRIYVYDKGYCDYNWCYKMERIGARFVTRIKSNSRYQVLEERVIDKSQEPHIVSDQVVALSNTHPRGGKINLLANKLLRLITVINPEDQKRYSFISNMLEVSASEIVEYYRKRWAIKLLFKWLKQNLTLTKFLCENENAIKTQIYAAMIVYMLVSMLKKICSNSPFKRMVDLLSWIKISLISHDIAMRPPDTPYKAASTKQLSWSFS